MITDAELLPSILEVLDRRIDRPGIDALWLFGSQARGEARADSDLDLAVLFLDRPSELERWELQGELEARLGREVDLVDLDAAPPILAMQILRHGRLLLDRNPARRHRHFARTVNLYSDLQILRRPSERALYERMRHG